MSFVAIGVIGGLTIGAGGLALGTVGALTGPDQKKAEPNPYALQALNQIMAEYHSVKREYQDIIKAKPWVVDQNELVKSERLMGQIDDAVDTGDVQSAVSLIRELPYFEQMYKDQIIYKHPHLTKMLQATAMTWAYGLPMPEEERLWKDVVGSSRRALGEEKEAALREAERIAAMSGRGGVSLGEHEAIIENYLRSYGEQEKDIRTKEIEDQWRRMDKGINLARGEREYGRSAVEDAWNKKMQVSSLTAQLASAMGGASAAAAPVAQPSEQNPWSRMSGVIGSASGLFSDVAGYGLYNDYMKSGPGNSAFNSSPDQFWRGMENEMYGNTDLWRNPSRSSSYGAGTYSPREMSAYRKKLSWGKPYSAEGWWG